MQSQQSQQLLISGSILNITLFQQKLMRNFYIINNKLKKLQSLSELQTKTRNLQKQIKFINNKVESMTQKIPKEGNACSKKDVQMMIKDNVIDMFNVHQQDNKIKQTELMKNVYSEIQKVYKQLSKSGNNNKGANNTNNTNNTNNNNLTANNPSSTKQTSFTAGSAFLQSKKPPAQPSKQLLNQLLSKQQSKYMNKIISSSQPQNQQQQSPISSQYEQMKKDIQKLYEIIQNMQINNGYKMYVQKQIREYQQMEKGDQKQIKRDKKSNSKRKQHNININGQKNLYDNYNQGASEIIRIQSTVDFNKRHNNNNQYNEQLSQMRSKQDFLSRKTFTNRNPATLLTKQDLLLNITQNNKKQSTIHIVNNKPSQSSLSKIQYIPQNKLLSKSMAQRSISLKKIQRPTQRKLKVDDIKDINSVLKQIELRLQNKVALDSFKIFIGEIQEKLEILRITKDNTAQLSDLRKMIFNLDSKVQYIISFLQSNTNEDNALIVKKNWTCISCDKIVEKFNNKTNGHLNWDSVQPKKISPNKIGGYGQTGQLASKIKGLLDNSGGAE